MPKPTLKLLQDIGSVQQLEGEAHRNRKAMFMSLMSPASIERLSTIMEAEWRASVGRWARADAVVLLDEIQSILCRAVCAWAGAPLSAEDARKRTTELVAMIEAAGSIGPRAWHALMLRRRTERWAMDVIEQARSGRLEVAESDPLQVVARHRELDGELLGPETAAVELINIFRPVVAVATFIMFAAHALHRHPEWRTRLGEAESEDLVEAFVQEVRRFYPFFPVVGGRVRNGFEWRGRDFAEGTWFLLDLYGTNHDPRIWSEPDEFHPERFLRWDGNAFGFIPQGGGEFDTDHRCPGEWITIDLMKRAVRLLVVAMRYDVPEQDLRIDLSRMPALPKSRFVIRNVSAIA